MNDFEVCCRLRYFAYHTALQQINLQLPWSIVYILYCHDLYYVFWRGGGSFLLHEQQRQHQKFVWSFLSLLVIVNSKITAQEKCLLLVVDYFWRIFQTGHVSPFVLHFSKQSSTLRTRHFRSIDTHKTAALPFCDSRSADSYHGFVRIRNSHRLLRIRIAIV